ncbi:MAG: acyl carrier protein [Eubacteriales bacterium]
MTFEKLKEVIVESMNCAPDEVTMEARLVEDLGADSLDAVELNMAIEDAFDVEIPDAALAELKTVGDLVGHIEKLLNI